VTASMSARKASHGTIFLIVSSGSPLALIASSRRSTSKKPFCPMTRSLHPPATAGGQRVRFATTWRDEFFEVPARRDRAGRNAGSGSERRDARCAWALRRRAGGICRTWNSAWSRAWFGAQAGFRTLVDGQGRNRRRFYRDEIGGLGPP